jgi:NADH:ubiquinone oxidoreductase subunit
MRRSDEVHVFDFDGTLFRSPTPHPTRVDAKFGEGALQRLLQPVSAGGLGWFQHKATLSPPYVPTSEVLNERHAGFIHNTAAINFALDIPRHLDEPSASSPPTLHFREDGTPLHTLFVESICRQFITLSAMLRQPQPADNNNNNSNYNDNEDEGAPPPAAARDTDGTVPLTSAPPPVILTYVMTGRDNTYRRRVADILASASMAPSGGLFLKPHPSAGTVKYKVCCFIRLVHQHRPRRIVYYEDRAEQGEKIEAGVRFMQWLLFMAVAHHRLQMKQQSQREEERPEQQQQQSTPSSHKQRPQLAFSTARHFVMSLPIDNDARIAEAFLSAARAADPRSSEADAHVRRMLQLVPPFHRSNYRDEIVNIGLLHQLLADSLSPQVSNAPYDETSFVDGVDGGRVADPQLPPPPIVECSPSFTFRIHYVARDEHPDSYLEEALEERLYKELEDAALLANHSLQQQQQPYHHSGGRGGGYHYHRGGGGSRGGGGHHRGRGSYTRYSHHNYSEGPLSRGGHSNSFSAGDEGFASASSQSSRNN